MLELVMAAGKVKFVIYIFSICPSCKEFMTSLNIRATNVLHSPSLSAHLNHNLHLSAPLIDSILDKTGVEDLQSVATNT